MPIACCAYGLRCGGGVDAGGNADGELVRERVGVLEGDGLAAEQWSAVVEEAVVVAQAPELARVHQAHRAEPPAPHVDARDRAVAAVQVAQALVDHVHLVRRHPARQRRRVALEDGDVLRARAPLVHPARPHRASCSSAAAAGDACIICRKQTNKDLRRVGRSAAVYRRKQPCK